MSPASRAVAILAFVVASSFASATEATAQSPIHSNERWAHAFRVDTVAEGFEDPWSVAFLPNGDLLVTEKPGRLRVVSDGVLRPEPVAGTPEVHYRKRQQNGLLDVVLHPDFESNRLVYLSYSKPDEDGTESTTAVVRGRFDGRRLTDVEEIFEADAWSVTMGHYGSRLAFDADGYLFVTVGDRQAPPRGDLESHPAQDLSNHLGTVLRLHDDGSVPSDNPFVGRSDARPEIWSYGHRNPQGMAIHPETGDVWTVEHGQQGGDELNVALRGRNYGWPVIGYGYEYGGGPLHTSRSREGMEDPVQFFTPSIAPSGLMIYTGDAFPEWRGSAFIGGMAHPQVARVPLMGQGDEAYAGRLGRPPLLMGFGRIRHVSQGPDGLIYLVVDDRYGGGLTPIVRLVPANDETS